MTDGVLIPQWPAPANVRACVTTRNLAGHSRAPFKRCNLGLRSGDDADVVRANRAGLMDALELPRAPRWLRQVHGIDVVDASAVDDEAEADAAITRDARMVVAVLTADCLPLLLTCEDGSIVAAAHAGWRGLAAGVIETTLARMATPAEHVLAWLGPAIGPRSYEVGPDVRSRFVDRDPASASAFTPTRAGHWWCDLYALARRRLFDAGVRKVFGGDFDTLTDARFYSYRREAKTGRFASLIWRT